VVTVNQRVPLRISDCGFQIISDSRFQIPDFRFQIPDCGFEIADSRADLKSRNLESAI